MTGPPELPDSLPTERMDPIAARHAGASRPLWREPGLWLAFAVLALAIVVVALWIKSVADQGHRDTAANRTAAAQNAAALSQANLRIRSLGGTPVSTPAAPPAPTVTVTAPAPAVHQIASTDITARHLFVNYVNPASRVDLGQVVGGRGPRGSRGPAGSSGPPGSPGISGSSGSPGSPGSTGDPGRGITGSMITSDGHLLISFTDDTTQDVGVVVGPQGDQGDQGPKGDPGDRGPAGVGVQDVDINDDGNLIVTLTDGTSIDAGPVPVGPPCPTGYTQATVTPRPLRSPDETWVVCDSTSGG